MVAQNASEDWGEVSTKQEILVRRAWNNDMREFTCGQLGPSLAENRSLRVLLALDQQHANVRGMNPIRPLSLAVGVNQSQ